MISQQKRIFFAHQSVGNNIVEGLSLFTAGHNLPSFNISDQLSPSGPLFYHKLIGQNTKPQSKLDDLLSFMHAHNTAAFDFVIFKLCYIDVDNKCDINTLYTSYNQCFEQLENEFSDTVFIHCTVPVKTEPQGIVNWTRKKLGNISHISYSNMARFKFNQLLRKKYSDNNRLFDIARLESTSLDGKHKSSKTNGVKYDFLLPEYTYDGGHLNTQGSEYIANFLYTMLENNNLK